jgi:putative ABC transport system permease protein
VAIYSQRRMQSRLWLEAIFSDGVLDPFITRHVGAAWMPPAEHTLQAQDRLAAVAPNIATARTESLLRETARVDGPCQRRGWWWWPACAWPPACWCWSGAVAASRSRQLYDATVMHAFGARHSLLQHVLGLGVPAAGHRRCRLRARGRQRTGHRPAARGWT